MLFQASLLHILFLSLAYPLTTFQSCILEENTHSSISDPLGSKKITYIKLKFNCAPIL